MWLPDAISAVIAIVFLGSAALSIGALYRMGRRQVTDLLRLRFASRRFRVSTGRCVEAT
ncbi:hypothetical protein [Xanthomonas sp. LMG 12462]|uniref:hypothetical protein n=1 Tax=Xanthomonas sp. LMG 12462 TaxID=1591134 RepID=UPI001D047F58|nr:hypothetical protein [Xanthomonas sp. LMG 12462]